MQSLDMDSHSLLEPRTPAYTHATVRRAFIVWIRCGQKNDFRDVCNYYHQLEALEATYSSEDGARSRDHEFSLYVKNPPTSSYQQSLFPNLYSSPHLDYQMYNQPPIQNHSFAETLRLEEFSMNAIKSEEKPISSVTLQEIFEASQVFKANAEINDKIAAKFDIAVFRRRSNKKTEQKLQKLNDVTEKSQNDEELKGTPKQDILETSRMIKNYCRHKQILLQTFLENFKEYATRCELNNTVNNVGLYIKRKTIHTELALAMVVRHAKYNNEASHPTTIIENNVIDNSVVEVVEDQNQKDLLAPFYNFTEHEINDKTDIKVDLSELLICNDDLITFNTSKDDSANRIDTHILFKKDDVFNPNVEFLTAENIVECDDLKYRKI